MLAAVFVLALRLRLVAPGQRRCVLQQLLLQQTFPVKGRWFSESLWLHRPLVVSWASSAGHRPWWSMPAQLHLWFLHFDIVLRSLNSVLFTTAHAARCVTDLGADSQLRQAVLQRARVSQLARLYVGRSHSCVARWSSVAALVFPCLRDTHWAGVS